MSEKRTAVVTGASRGIGRAIALELGGRGAQIVGTATSASGAAAISEYLAAAGLAGRGAVLDVAKPDSVDAFFKELDAAEGTPAILVNNAGVTRDGLLMRMSAEDWQAVLETDLSSIYRTCKAVMRGMMKARYGRIVNIASVIAVMGNAGQSNYAAAKAGLFGLTRSLAKELGGRGVRVNAVAPGYIQTDMTSGLPAEIKEASLKRIPLGRLGEGADIARAVRFLVSEEAAYVTGITLVVDGGMSL
jgi:3-oxoacyl-[acyl-carrier protein] reductase